MREAQLYPEPTVGAVILNSKGEILLVKSHKWGDRFTIAGGHVEVGEKLEAALRREIKEEVGLSVTDVSFLMTQEAIFSKEFWERRHFIFFDFVCTARGGKVKVDGEEIQGYKWVAPNKALKLNLDTFTRNMVKKYLGSRTARR